MYTSVAEHHTVVACSRSPYGYDATLVPPGSFLDPAPPFFLDATGPLRCDEGGDRARRFAAVDALTDALCAYGLLRREPFLAIGGGCLLDIAVLVVPFVRVPTTLLAMLDTSVGVKNGALTGTIDIKPARADSSGDSNVSDPDEKVIEVSSEMRTAAGGAGIIPPRNSWTRSPPGSSVKRARAGCSWASHKVLRATRTPHRDDNMKHHDAKRSRHRTPSPLQFFERLRSAVAKIPSEEPQITI